MTRTETTPHRLTGMDRTHATPDGRPRGDRPDMAAWELRRVEHAHRWHRRNRVAVIVVAVLIAAWAVAALLLGIAQDQPWQMMGGLFSAVVCAALLRYSVLSGAAAATVLSLLAAGAASLELAVRADAGWAAVVPIAVAAAATGWVLIARTVLIPRTGATMIGQWIAPVLLLLAPAAGVPAVLGLGAVLTAAAMFLLGNGLGWLRARRTASSAGWAVRLPGLKIGSPAPGGAPADTHSGRWRHIVDAQAATARELDALGDDWVVLHSRIAPHTGILVDHVLIGPPGLVVVDTQTPPVVAPAGAGVAATFDDLFAGAAVPDSGHTTPVVDVDEIVSAAAMLEQAIRSGGALPVATIIALHGPGDGQLGHTETVVHDDAHRTVHVAAGPHLSTYLDTALPRVCSPTQVAAAAQIVDYLMPRAY